MKKLLFITSLLLRTFSIFSQSTDGIKPGWGNLDYSVPESPAFKILGSDPDNILRPTSVRTAAISIGNYLLTTGSLIPRNLAVEVSPLLANPHANLAQYNQNKFWYRMRLSFGTNVKANGAFDIAEGVRFTLIDKSDLRTHTWFLEKLATYAESKSAMINQAAREYLKENPSSGLTLADIIEKLDSDSTLQNEIWAIACKLRTDKSMNADYVEHLRDSIRTSLWNAPVWELGAATLQSSADSLIKNIGQIARVALWTNGGYPLGTKAQLLGGIKVGTAKDDSSKWQTNFSAGVRIFYGSNEVRGYLQGQYDYQNQSSNGNASLGCEFNITNGLWVDFALTVTADGDGNTSFKPLLNLKFGTPEKRR